jgi:predicted methyltransferase
VRRGTQGECLMRGFACSFLAAVALAAVFSASMGQTAPDYAAVVGAPDRTDADRKNDERREPVKILAMTGAQPGWRILDMGAGAGYSTELMARAASPTGEVLPRMLPT